jgi:hypothetical protein
MLRGRVGGTQLMGDSDAAREFDLSGVADFDWHKPDSLRLICLVARGFGLLGDVDVMCPVVDDEHQDFMLTVGITDQLTLASAKFKWNEVGPPSGMVGVEAARYVLDRIDGIAQRTRAGLAEYTWLRVASELQQVRRILAKLDRG